MNCEDDIWENITQPHFYALKAPRDMIETAQCQREAQVLKSLEEKLLSVQTPLTLHVSTLSSGLPSVCTLCFKILLYEYFSPWSSTALWNHNNNCVLSTLHKVTHLIHRTTQKDCLFFFFPTASDGTRGLTYAGQALCHQLHPSPSCFSYLHFTDKGSQHSEVKQLS